VVTDDANGDCFKVALWLVYDNPEWTLCHGMVVRPEDGLHHWHAWCEYDETHVFPTKGKRVQTVRMRWAVDRANGNNVQLPVEFYRKLGQVHDVTEYTHDQTMRLASEHKHYGPWEPAEQAVPASAAPVPYGTLGLNAGISAPAERNVDE
jgi:hypothetical protein